MVVLVPGFQVCHSLGGGTGSGMGTLLISKIREEYPGIPLGCWIFAYFHELRIFCWRDSSHLQGKVSLYYLWLQLTLLCLQTV